MATTPTTHFCHLCSKPFTDPRLLPCLHVFCKSCLESLESQNEGTLTCPTCYKTSPHPPADLPRHLRIEREAAISRIQEGGEGTVCGSCGESNKIEAYCEDCSSSICSDCVGMHKRLKALKSHKVFPLNSTELHSVSVKQHISCTAHPSEVVKYYCISCSILVCSECILDHKKHDCRNLEEAGVEVRAKLQSVLPEVEKAIPPLSEAVEKINSIVECIGVNGEERSQDINDTFSLITSAVEKRRLELLKEVKNSVTANVTQLEIQKECFEKMAASLKLALASGGAACNEYSSVEVLAVKDCILQAAHSFLEQMHSLNLYPVCNSSLLVEISPSEVIDMVSTLGNVRASFCYPPLCSLSGIDPKLAIGAAKGCESVFTLQTRDSKGEDVAVGGAEVKCRMTMAESDVRNCTINDLDNGRYEISFNSPNEGLYQLHVSINNASINDSPFTVNVRDYTTIISPVATLKTADNPQYVDIGFAGLHYISMAGGSIELFKSGKMVRKIPQSKLEVNVMRGIAVDEQTGILFVASANNNKIIKATLDGEVIASVGTRGSGELEFNWPMGLCLTEGGLLLISDARNERIQVLGSDLSFIRSIPCLNVVYGVSVDYTGNVHAAAGDRVEVFTIDGGKVMEYGKGVLHQAGSAAFLLSCSKYSFVTDAYHCKIFVFDWLKNVLVHSFPAGNYPLGIKVNQEGTLITCCDNSCEILSF